MTIDGLPNSDWISKDWISADWISQWLDQDNLIGVEARQVAERLQQRLQALSHSNSQPHSSSLPIVLLATADAAEFLAGFFAAVVGGCPLVLGNPEWAIGEWQQVFQQLCPDLLWIDAAADLRQAIDSAQATASTTALTLDWAIARPPAGAILIPTGGSSGQVRFAVHTGRTLTASALGFKAYFQCDRIHSCCILPLYHVSGLMQIVRSVLTNGLLAVFQSKDFAAHLIHFDPTGFFLSLVPTQLQRLLSDSSTADSSTVRRLSQFQTVLLGGAPAWDDLLIQARQQQIRLAPTYGMTETASQVVTLKPQDFLDGKTGCGQILPHAAVQILDAAGSALPPGEVGTIALQSRSLMLGYHPLTALPEAIPNPQFLTDDCGYFDAQGYLHLLGRNSQKIISGGENVFPGEVESAICKTGLVQDVCVVGIPDRHWGEAVAAACVVLDPQTSGADLAIALTPQLAKYKHPKHWILLPNLPRSPQGKINARAIAQLCREQIKAGKPV